MQRRKNKNTFKFLTGGPVTKDTGKKKKGRFINICTSGTASQVAQSLIICLPVQETQQIWVQSLGQEDPLEKGRATHSKYPCLDSPMDRGAWWATVHRVTKGGT